MLTEQAKAALERYRQTLEDMKALSVSGDPATTLENLASIPKDRLNQFGEDGVALSRLMLRLYPAGWDEPVSKDGIESCGFSRSEHTTEDYGIRYSKWACGRLSTTDKQAWFIDDYYLPMDLQPRNMLDVWTLMSRLNIPNPLDGDK